MRSTVLASADRLGHDRRVDLAAAFAALDLDPDDPADADDVALLRALVARRAAAGARRAARPSVSGPQIRRADERCVAGPEVRWRR
jgi:hypothetical protein